jgi:hypothetical protein
VVGCPVGEADDLCLVELEVTGRTAQDQVAVDSVALPQRKSAVVAATSRRPPRTNTMASSVGPNEMASIVAPLAWSGMYAERRAIGSVQPPPEPMNVADRTVPGYPARPGPGRAARSGCS